MSRLHIMEGPGGVDVSKLDNFSAGLVYLAEYAKANPGATVREALWGESAQAGSMNGLGFSVTKALKKAGKISKNVSDVASGAVRDYASDIKNQGIVATLGRLTAAVATGGTSEFVFAAKSAITSGVKNIPANQQKALAVVASTLATSPEAAPLAVVQVEEAGARWKAIQDQAKSIAFAKVAGIPVVVVAVAATGGVLIYRHKSRKAK